MKKIFCVTFFLLLTFFAGSYSYETRNLSPQEGLKQLLQGNERFVTDKLLHPDRSKDRREATVSQQLPYAIVLGCADSRIPPEIVFDQGIGDIFTVRVAGNVAGPIELESVEYSVVVNKSSIIVVLGHENCGAVKAVLAKTTQDIASIAALIEPSIQRSKDQQGNELENSIKENVRQVVASLKKNPVLSKYMSDGKLDIVGGYYNLGTGKVEILK